MVAPHQQQPHLGFDNFSCIVGVVCRQYQGLDRGLQRYAQQLGHIFASAFARCRCQRASRCGCAARLCRGQRLGFFHVGGVIALGAIHNRILAGGCDHLKLFAQIAANRTAVSRHGPITQTEAVKNTPISLCHGLVADLRRGRIAVKTVGVFHGEFTPTHQPKTRSSLVTEFGLDLVEVFG